MWIKQVFGTDKAVIGMVHLRALPGTPLYDTAGGVAAILDAAAQDLDSLIRGGIDSVMFCNENDRPYLISAGSEQVAVMAAIIGRLKSHITVPFGVDMLWDAEAAISIAHATGAAFVREVLTGVYSSDMGLFTPDAGKALRHRRAIGADKVKVLFNINAEFASPLGSRDTTTIAKSVAFGSLPDGLCVSGAMTGTEVDQSVLSRVKNVVRDVPVFVNTGVRADNVSQYLSIADAAIVGTSLKFDAVTWNPVDPVRVRSLMQAVRNCR